MDKCNKCSNCYTFLEVLINKERKITVTTILLHRLDTILCPARLSLSHSPSLSLLLSLSACDRAWNVFWLKIKGSLIFVVENGFLSYFSRR
jgi:hypothetical protein